MAVKLDECSNSDYNQIARAITAFNLQHLPPNSSENMGSFGYVLRNGSKVIGGVTGKILLGNCLSIDILWVEEDYRKRGYGTQLMQAIENGAKLLKSHLAQVDTFDFQALEFYQKNGYTVFGTLDDCPCVGNKRYYLKKKLL